MRARRVPDPIGPVERAVAAAVAEFCATNDPNGTLMVVVQTGALIEPDGRQALRLAAEAAGREACARLVVVRLRVLQRAGLAVDQAEVSIEVVPAPPQPEPLQVTLAETVAPPSTRPYTVNIGLDPSGAAYTWTLRVIYLADPCYPEGPSFTFSLTAADGWVPLGREDETSRRRRRVLDFGQMRALPSGWLIDVRCTSQGLFFRRSGARPSYVVSVNDEPLTPGVEFVGAHEGIVDYHRPPEAQRTVLRYVLAREWAG